MNPKDKHASIYQELFDNSPISIWLQDFSAVKKYISGLEIPGDAELDVFLDSRAEDMRRCAEKVQILDLNQAGMKLYGAVRKNELMGGLNRVLTKETHENFRRVVAALWRGEDFEGVTVNRTLAGKMIHIILKVSIPPGYEVMWDRVFVSVIDITARIRAENKNRKLINELQQALEEIKILKGILPICSHCKKIRDDRGLWNHIEVYIRKHSEAEFSHSICGECLKKYYPDLKIDDT
jgi:hypothetical protein